MKIEVARQAVENIINWKQCKPLVKSDKNPLVHKSKLPNTFSRRPNNLLKSSAKYKKKHFQRALFSSLIKGTSKVRKNSNKFRSYFEIIHSQIIQIQKLRMNSGSAFYKN